MARRVSEQTNTLGCATLALSVVPDAKPNPQIAMEEKLQKLYASRTKLQKELKICHELIDEAIGRKDRRVEVEKLDTDSKSTFQAAFEKNEDLLKLAAKTENSTDLTRILEEWSEGLIALNDEYLSKARAYINSIGETEE